MPERPRVVIVGAGFAGLQAARILARAPAEVTILDCNNYHTFFPLLYQVAAAELEPEDIVYPVRSTLRHRRNMHLYVNRVTGIDMEKKLVLTADRSFPYDYLILALGSMPYFFNVEGAEQHTFQLKSLEDAIAIRNHILMCFERALVETDPQKRRQMLTFAVIGGGPTGVEFSGALAELIRGPLAKDYAALDFYEVRLLLLEATDRLVPGIPERLQNYTLRRLQKMGVEVLLEAPVTRIDASSLALKDGTTIPLETAVWTAGVHGAAPAQPNSLPLLRNGQVKVLPNLQVDGHPEIYIAGDMAHVEKDGHPLPMVAPLAMQEGRTAAKNLLRQLKGQETRPFRYFDLGTAVAIGRNAAVVDLLGQRFTGFIAWILWVIVSIYRVIGFRNRLIVLVNWAWDYLFFERGVRLIVPLVEEELPGTS